MNVATTHVLRLALVDVDAAIVPCALVLGCVGYILPLINVQSGFQSVDQREGGRLRCERLVSFSVHVPTKYLSY